MARTAVPIRNQMDAIRTGLKTTIVPSLGVVFPYPVGSWIRPRESAPADPPAHLRYEDPPFVNVRSYPSAADMDGSIRDHQADQKLRVQIQAVGLIDTQAEQVLDLTQEIMVNKANFTIPNRRIMDLSKMIVSGGVSPDYDILPVVFYCYDIYELWTTPAP